MSDTPAANGLGLVYDQATAPSQWMSRAEAHIVPYVIFRRILGAGIERC
jgi:hypothetical protein